MKYTLSRDLVPVVILLFLAFAAEYSGLDLYLAGKIYQLEGHQWLLKDSWLFKTLLHDDAREVVRNLFCVVVLAWLLSLLPRRLNLRGLQHWRRPLGYLVITEVISITLVSLIKRATDVSCPWGLSQFGGHLPYFPVYVAPPADFPPINCFPAGHASATFAWFGVWFIARRYFPRWRWEALASVILAGELFGITQQLRGAHFLSHDLTTAAICYGIAALGDALILSRAIHFSTRNHADARSDR